MPKKTSYEKRNESLGCASGIQSDRYVNVTNVRENINPLWAALGMTSQAFRRFFLLEPCTDAHLSAGLDPCVLRRISVA